MPSRPAEGGRASGQAGHVLERPDHLSQAGQRRVARAVSAGHVGQQALREGVQGPLGWAQAGGEPTLAGGIGIWAGGVRLGRIRAHRGTGTGSAGQVHPDRVLDGRPGEV